MSKKKTYEVSRHFSRIENLQNEKTVTYLVIERDDGSEIVLESITHKKTHTESCFLPRIEFDYAKNVATLLCENSFDINAWKEELEDIGINYVLTESCAS